MLADHRALKSAIACSRAETPCKCQRGLEVPPRSVGVSMIVGYWRP
jgi:hypothetical protein